MSILNWNVGFLEELKAWRDHLFLDDTNVEYIAKEYNQKFEEIKRGKEYPFKNDDLLDVVDAKGDTHGITCYQTTKTLL